MTTNKSYDIDSFEKMCNILTDQNKFDLLICFCKCFDIYISFVDDYRIKHAKESDGKSNTDLFKFYFTWTDDGENTISDFKIKNSNTGEFFKIKTPTNNDSTRA